MAKVDHNEHEVDGLAVRVARANAGDSESLTELRAYLSDTELCSGLAKVIRKARAAWVQLIAGDDQERKEVIEEDLAQAAAGLVGADATPLEQVLAQRIALAQLRVTYLESSLEAGEGIDSRSSGLTRLRCGIKKARREHERAVRMLNDIHRLLPARSVTSRQ